MKNKLDRFLRWLWPAYYSETAKCQECDFVLSKTRMIHDDIDGWFCNQACADSYWFRRQGLPNPNHRSE